jgi:uncharacterized protein YjeT (DUF2065 family)
MNPILFIVSILWIAAGTALIIYTRGTRALWSRMLDRYNHRWLAVMPISVGFILVVSGFYYPGMFWLALVLGVLALLKGFFLIFGPSRQVKTLFDWWLYKAVDGTLRLYGLFAFILGSVLLSYIL